MLTRHIDLTKFEQGEIDPDNELTIYDDGGKLVHIAELSLYSDVLCLSDATDREPQLALELRPVQNVFVVARTDADGRVQDINLHFSYKK